MVSASLLARIPAVSYRARLTPDLQVEGVDESVSILIGYRRDRLLGASSGWLSFIEKEDHPLLLKKYDVLKAGGAYEETYHVRAADGEVLAVTDSAQALPGEEGEPEIEGILWSKTHPTFQAETRCHQMMDALADMVLVKGPGSRIVWANRAFCEYYGMSVNELRGLIDAAFNEPCYTAHYLEDDAEVFRTGRALHIPEEPVTRHDGTVHYFETVKTPIFDETSGRVIMTIGVSRDLTERKKAEAQVQRSQNFLYSIIENIPNMIFVKDAGDLRFVRINRAGEELLGYPEEDLIGKNDYDFFPKEEADFFVQKDREVLERGVLVDIPEEPIATRYKGVRYLHTKKIPIADEEGRRRYLVGISEDITEQKSAAEALRRARDELEDRVRQRTAELAEVNKQQELLLSELDHRVKNMLNLVLSIGKQSLRRSPDLKSFERAFLGRLMGLAEVHKVLRRNRWEGISLHELARLCFQIASAGASSNVEITGPDLRLEPKTAQTLYMALYELATNAIKYGALSSPEGRLGLHWEVTSAAAPHELCLHWTESQGPAVTEDAGRGFGRTLLERIIPFEIGGSTDLKFGKEGVRCDITIPLHDEGKGPKVSS